MAAVLVLVHHVAGMEQRFGASGAWLPHFLHKGFVGVDIFFVVSGFVIGLVAAQVAEGTSARVWFTLDRLARIYPLYWLVSLLLWLGLLFEPNLVRTFGGAQPALASSLLLWPQRGFPLLMVGWTLVHEVYFYFVVALGLFWGTRGLRLLLPWAAAILLGSALFDHSPVLQVVFNPLTLEFIFGGLVVIWYRSKPGLHPWGRRVLVLSGLFLFGFGLFSLKVDPIQGSVFRSLTLGGGTSLLLLVLVDSERRQGAVSPRWMACLGDASYSLYLWHLLVVYGFGWIWYAKAPAALKPLGPILAMGLAIAWAVLSWRFLESPLAGIWRNTRSALIRSLHYETV